MGISLALVAVLTIPWIRAAMADSLLLYWESYNIWQYGELKGVDQAIATQRVLNYIGISLAFVAVLTIPWIRAAIADGLLLYRESYNIWQYGELEGVDQAIATQRVLNHMGISLALVASLTIPWIRAAIADSLLLYREVLYIWQYGELKGADQAIATQRVLNHMGISLALVASLTIPWIRAAMADSLLLYREVLYIWQYNELQFIHNAITTIYIFQRSSVGACCRELF